ncbi:hypothetical protein DOY81_005594 [Sarcophaga bullata]|nr:hypothetical protein DOY81_005594 [Sarcophaga bullata]
MHADAHYNGGCLRRPYKNESRKFVLWPSLLVLCCLCFVAHAQPIVEDESFIKAPKYLDNIEIGSLFADLQRQYPHMARAYSIGKTLQDRDMNVLAVSAPGDVLEGDLLKPIVKVSANIYGDETVGRQIVLYMAQYLVVNYVKVPEVQELLNTTEIHFLPSCNPDGFAAAKFCIKRYRFSGC